MPPEIETFLKTAADTLLKLEVLLFYTRNPSTVDTVQGLAGRLYRDADQIETAVRSLAENKILQRYELGDGSYRLYTLTEDSACRELSRRLYDMYHDDPSARIEIIRRIMTWQQCEPTTPQRA